MQEQGNTPRPAPPRTPLPGEGKTTYRRGGGSAPPLKRKGGVGRVIRRTLGVIGVLLLSVVALLFGAITVICKGPFPMAKERFVLTVLETSAAKFTAYIYLSPEEVDAIVQANKVQPPDDVTDTTKPFDPPPADEGAEDIEIVQLQGPDYNFVGKMMIVKDPSRMYLATLDAFGADIRGKRIEDFAAENNATAAINGGFFDDPGGVGKGGQPLGLLIRGGQIVNGNLGMTSTIIGFDADNHLVVGEMSGQKAMDMGIRDAVAVAPHIMPPLIINGNAAEITGNGSGLNPRTALGQRADGAVLMLVIDGRQPHSIGASIQDCLDVMLEFGAINASMLDGGSSSVMVYEGETINICSSLYGSRAQPAAWLVR